MNADELYEEIDSRRYRRSEVSQRIRRNASDISDLPDF